MFLQESLVLDLHSLPLHGSVACDEVDVLVREDGLTLHAAHPGALILFSPAVFVVSGLAAAS